MKLTRKNLVALPNEGEKDHERKMLIGEETKKHVKGEDDDASAFKAAVKQANCDAEFKWRADVRHTSRRCKVSVHALTVPESRLCVTRLSPRT